MQPDEQQQPQTQPQQIPVAPPAQPQPYVAPATPRPVSLPPEPDQSTTPAYPSDAVPETPTEQPISQAASEPIHWQAAEYVHREKDPLWFMAFAVVVIVFIAIAVFVIKSITFAVLIPIMAAALLVYTHRPPRIFDYTLSRQGLHINDLLYPFSEFKSFAVVHGIDQYSIMFIPVKRFKPAVSANFPIEAGEAIVDMLAARLPMQEMHPDVVDRIIRKLHL